MKEINCLFSILFQAREKQEEIAIDMKILDKILLDSQNEATEDTNRKVRSVFVINCSLFVNITRFCNLKTFLFHLSFDISLYFSCQIATEKAGIDQKWLKKVGNARKFDFSHSFGFSMVVLDIFWGSVIEYLKLFSL